MQISTEVTISIVITIWGTLLRALSVYSCVHIFRCICTIESIHAWLCVVLVSWWRGESSQVDGMDFPGFAQFPTLDGSAHLNLDMA